MHKRKKYEQLVPNAENLAAWFIGIRQRAPPVLRGFVGRVIGISADLVQNFTA